MKPNKEHTVPTVLSIAGFDECLNSPTCPEYTGGT